MNYKRIFGLKPSAMFTIDPITFEVTNQFDYADLKKLKVRSARGGGHQALVLLTSVFSRARRPRDPRGYPCFLFVP